MDISPHNDISWREIYRNYMQSLRHVVNRAVAKETDHVTIGGHIRDLMSFSDKQICLFVAK